MQLNTRRSIFYGIVAAAVAAAIAYSFIPGPAAIETAEVRSGYMMVAVEEEGKTRIKDRFDVSAPVSGYAHRIALKAGNPVHKGQTITILEPLRATVPDLRSRAHAEAQVAAAEASLKAAQENSGAARAGAVLAAKEFDRIKKLFGDSLVSRETFDRAEADMLRTSASLRSSEFAVEVARYQRESALTALKYSAADGPADYKETVAITSPVNGSVLKVRHESEGVVNEGEALIEIGDPEALEVEVELLTADAVRVEPGMTVLFERWGGARPLKGKVRLIEPAGFTKVSALGVEEQRVLVISDFLSPKDEWSRLGDGFRVEASFILWEDHGVLQVPASSIFRYGEGWAAFAVENNRAVLRPVKTGQRGGLHVQILSGLSEGEVVIPHPDSSIKDGTPVRYYKKDYQD